ncbi:hypothetical protein Trydic_g20750 [Trypoxylus dichotomus]
MEQVSFAPPPLPPKTRRSPLSEEEATVNRSASADDRASNNFLEAREGHSSAASTGTTTNSIGNHVVKIRINPSVEVPETNNAPCVRISVNSEDTNIGTMSECTATPFFYYGPYNSSIMSSGQVSPSDTLDSGTCSDLDGTPPPLPKKKSAGVSVTLIGGQSSMNHEGDSDNDSNISCDSLNSGDLPAEVKDARSKNKASAFLPQRLLRDIRDRSTKQTQSPETIKQDEEDVEDDVSKLAKLISPKIVIDQSSYQYRKQKEEQDRQNKLFANMLHNPDQFFNFHLNEHIIDEASRAVPVKKTEDETFAGLKNVVGCEDSKTIRSAKGTVRGVKNRVRAGIATFLQINSTAKNYKEKDAGKVVVYTTTMGIVRETYNTCMKVKQILRTLLIKYEERDVFMSSEYQTEIRDRMRCDHILVPQVFVDGQHIGDAETVERLNETGELRRILKPYKSMDVCTTCKVCGGYRLLPCPVCNGSKKSVHRNHFTTEFVALKCMNCDEVGLVKCTSC